MARVFVLIYGAAAYLLFLLVFLYSIAFVGNLPVMKTIDSGAQGDLVYSLLINVLLLSVFAVQHSIMARPGFKKWWTQIIPESIERSTFVLLTNLVLILLYWKWQPLTGVVWDVTNATGAMVLMGLFWLGWLIVLTSTFMINHFDLFGLRQIYLNLKNEKYSHLPFTTKWLYQFVRHPIMLGFVIAFWSTPRMSVGHLMFAAITTAYIVIALHLEERDLVTSHGEMYKQYKREVPMLLPLGRKKRG